MKLLYLAMTASLPLLVCVILLFLGLCIFSAKKALPALSLPFIYGVGILILIAFLTRSIIIGDPEGITGVLHFFLIPEFIIFILYIRKQVRDEFLSRVLMLFQQLFPISLGYILVYNRTQVRINTLGAGVDYLLIIVACLIFYHDFSCRSATNDRATSPPYWVITGILSTTSIRMTAGALFETGSGVNMHVATLIYTISFILLFASFTISLNLLRKSG